MCAPDEIELKFGIWKWWFFRRGESWSAWRKTPQSKGENQQQRQPKYTVYVCCHLVGDQCFHHGAPPLLPTKGGTMKDTQGSLPVIP